MKTSTKTAPILEHLPRRTGPEWLMGQRKESVDALDRLGFPNKKTEAWRFTPVAPITDVPFQASSAEATSTTDWDRLARHAAEDGTFQVMLVNGRPRVDRAGVVPDGVRMMSLQQALRDEPSLLEAHLGARAPREHFGALNTALFDDGVVIRVQQGEVVDRPIHLIHVGMAQAGPTAAYPRVLVVLEGGSELSLVESFVREPGDAPHLTNVVEEIVIGRDARLRHVRIYEGQNRTFHVGGVYVTQDQQSRYVSQVATLGGDLFRLDLDVRLDGAGAECNLDGVYVASGDHHVDHHTMIDHAKPRCASRERYRGVLDGRGKAVFDGTIVVRRDAQHTSAHQENRNLLLSDDVGVHTKPHLRIDADDVRCSHGATIGALDEDALFYLRARGIGEAEARALLTYAFVRELVDGVSPPPLRHRISKAVLDRLPHGDIIRETL